MSHRLWGWLSGTWVVSRACRDPAWGIYSGEGSSYTGGWVASQGGHIPPWCFSNSQKHIHTVGDSLVCLYMYVHVHVCTAELSVFLLFSTNCQATRSYMTWVCHSGFVFVSVPNHNVQPSTHTSIIFLDHVVHIELAAFKFHGTNLTDRGF